MCCNGFSMLLGVVCNALKCAVLLDTSVEYVMINRPCVRVKVSILFAIHHIILDPITLD